METLRKNQNEMVKIKQHHNRKENVFMCSSTDLTQPKTKVKLEYMSIETSETEI